MRHYSKALFDRVPSYRIYVALTAPPRGRTWKHDEELRVHCGEIWCLYDNALGAACGYPVKNWCFKEHLINAHDVDEGKLTHLTTTKRGNLGLQAIKENTRYYNELIEDHRRAGGVVPEDPGNVSLWTERSYAVPKKRKRSLPTVTNHKSQLTDSPNTGEDANLVSSPEVVSSKLAVVETTTETARIWRILDELACPILVARLKNTEICALDDCPEETLRMWQSSGGMPRVLPSSKIYHTDDRYSGEELLNPEHHWHPAKVRLYKDGVTQGVSKSLLHHVQYSFHTKDQQPYLAFVQLNLQKKIYAAPGMGEHEQSAEALLASRCHFTDLHSDHGLAVVSSPVEQCEKIYVMYPSVPSNFAAVEPFQFGTDRLRGACPSLEGGLLARLNETQAITMTSGTIHAVWTVVKGPLITLSYLESCSVQGMSTWIRWSPSTIKEEDKGVLLENWIDAALMDLYTCNQKIVLEAWLQVKQSFLHYAKELPEQAQKLKELWKNFLNDCMFTDELRETYAEDLWRDIQKLDQVLDEQRKSCKAGRRKSRQHIRRTMSKVAA